MRSLCRILASLTLTVLASAAGAQTGVDGGALYQARCAVCHQSDGSGITVPPTFPPVDAEPGRIAAAGEKGRKVLVDVVLFGLRGELTVDGVRYAYGQEMPGWRNLLSDPEVAALIDHVLSSWANAAALPSGGATVRAREVTTERRRELSPTDVYALWQALTP